MLSAKLLLRIGIAFVFLYAAAFSFITPENWIWYIPDWMQKIIPGKILLDVHAVFEMILGIWLLTGWKTAYPALLGGLDLLVITVINIAGFDIVFRDIGLCLAAFALASLYKDQLPLPKK